MQIKAAYTKRAFYIRSGASQEHMPNFERNFQLIKAEGANQVKCPNCHESPGIPAQRPRETAIHELTGEEGPAGLGFWPCLVHVFAICKMTGRLKPPTHTQMNTRGAEMPFNTRINDISIQLVL